jgi:hypothetical protein
MKRVGGAAAVAKKDDFTASAKGGCGFFSKLGDAADEFVRERLLYAGTFLELTADLFGGVHGRVTLP